MKDNLFKLFLILSISACRNYESADLQNSGSVAVDGTMLNYLIRGRGPDCLVIGSSVYYPKTFSDSIHNFLKMHYVDLKWFAEDYQPQDLSKVNVASIVEDVEEIRKKLGLKKPLVMGHSIHGTIAMEYAKAYPENVMGVVIIGSPSYWGNEDYFNRYEAHWATASDERKAIQDKNHGDFSEIDRLTGKEKVAADYNMAAPQYWYDPYYDATWLWDGMTVHTGLTDHLFGTAFHDYDMFENPVEIPVPVLVMMGQYDYIIPYTLWETEYPSVPNYTFHLFEKSGHTPQLEQPEQFNRQLISWLKTNDLDE